MSNSVQVGDRRVGDGERVFIIGEIGINHNGSMEIAKKLIDGAALAGCDAVKFQKRTPELCVPKEQRDVVRETPWGKMTYLEYRYMVEFDEAQYAEIDRYCKDRKILWFASCWDEESVDFIEKFDPVCYKAASAALTDISLLKKKQSTGKPLILSTGMSTQNEIHQAVHALGREKILIAHSTSTYPCPPRRTQPPDDPDVACTVPRMSDRLFGTRDRIGDDVGGGGNGGDLCGTAHHDRPCDVGERPGGVGGDRWIDAARVEHP